MRRFDVTIGNLTLRSCGTHLLQGGEHYTAEIVKWFGEDKKKCYTIAYYIEKSEGYDLKFVGMRPLSEEVNKDDLFYLIGSGYKLLGCE